MMRRILGSAAALFAACALHAQQFSDLYAFDNTPHGANAEGDLVIASNNVIFGTTLEGGFGDGGGTVYSVNSDGSGYTVLQSFNYNGDTNGFGPSTGLVLSGDMLYGTCSEGGSSNYGTIFGLQTNGNNFVILHEFTGGADEGSPMGAMVLASNVLFGTTQYGTVFSVHTDGSNFTNLHVFSGADGQFPNNLSLSGNTLYGTTSSGGNNDGGTVFSLRTDGSGFTNLHVFTASVDGSSPGGGVLVAGDTLYGTAPYGGLAGDGSVFSLSTNGVNFTVLHFFTGTNDGSHPYTQLAFEDPTLFGTTISGGSNNAGVVFSLNAGGGFFVDLFDFSSNSGSYPSGGLILANNILYGVTSEGSSNNWGDIYGFHLPAAQSLEITSQPQGETNVSIDSEIILSVTAQSSITPALEYQWMLNGVNLPGATNSQFIIADFQPTNGGVYSVAVSDGVSWVISANAALVPAAPFVTGNNDTNSPAILDSSLTGVVISENTNATAQPGESPILPGNPPAKSIWFQWTAPATGVTTFTTEGSGFDTVLGAFTPAAIGGPSFARAGLADDDGGGYLTSLITFNSVQGDTYLIGVDGHAGASGNVVLNWNDIPGPFGPTIITPPVLETVVSNTADADFTCDADNGQALWFMVGDSSVLGGGENFGIGSVTASTVGEYYADVSGNSSSVRSEPFEVQINVLEDGTTDTNSLAYNKFSDADAHPFAQPPPVGQHVRTGTGDVRGFTVSQTFSTVGDVSEPGEPLICGQLGGAPAWYAYVAPTNGSLSVNTTGSDFNTMLAVYDGGSSFATLTNLGCGYAANANQPQPQILIGNAEKKQTFYIQVDGYRGASGAVQLNINFGQPVTAPTPPQDQYVALGSSASLSIIAEGSIPIAYQWQVNGTNIPSATNATLLFPSVSASQTGVYTVVVSNLVSQSSYSATLGISSPPVLTNQPQSGTVPPGSTATLNVGASGSPAPVYFWNFNGSPIGGQSNSLVIPNFQGANEGTYSVLASNRFGVAQSSNALLFLNSLRLLSPTLSAGMFQLQLTGNAGSNYLIQTSTNLISWLPLSSFNAANGIIEITDTNAGAYPLRFYRAVTN